jgi:hypothetical protein
MVEPTEDFCALHQQVGGGGCLPRPRRADRAPDAPQHGLPRLARRRRLVAGQLVVLADGGAPAADGAGFEAVAGQGGEVGRDDADMGRQARGASGDAPGGEVGQSEA